MDSEDELDYIRRQWDEGEQRLTRHTSDSRRREVLERVVDEITGALERRVGQTFTMAQLVDQYHAAEGWCLGVAHDSAPESPWAWDLSVVQDAAFNRYLRRAQDYEP